LRLLWGDDNNMIRIFIGFDTRETVAHHVCAHSIIRQSTQPVALTPLALGNLAGYSERHGDGSNQFVYSRFLVPHLMEHAGWALYLDGDMILLADIAALWSMRDQTKAVQVVQHDYRTRAQSKYLGAPNHDYPRKNWSSVVLWNCAHPAHRLLTPAYVEAAPGSVLHRFAWLDDGAIGALPVEWNWLPDEFGENPNAKLLHWTLGTPCFAEHAKAPSAALWHRERERMNGCVQYRSGQADSAQPAPARRAAGPRTKRAIGAG
jgi:hypothetical protein